MAKGFAVSPSKMEQQYRAESDFRTLSDASDIKRDPDRMKGVQKHARKTMSSCSRVMGGRR